MNKTILASFAALILGAGVARAQTCTDIPPGLVAWWRAETNALDSLSTNHGTLLNGATYASGKVGGAFTFDGVNDYVEVADSPGLRITNVMTLEFWAKRQRLDDVDIVLEKGGDWTQNQTTYGVGFHVNAYSNAFYFFFAGGGRMAEGVHDLNWHHYALVARSGDVDPLMFIDGAPKAIFLRFGSTGPMSFFPSNLPLHLGAQVGTFNYFGNLWLDEVGIYNRALTSNEIAAIYSADSAGKNADKPYFLTLPPLPDGGVGTPYSVQFGAAITPGPHTFSLIDGTLPVGLELTTNGLLYGTPTVGTTNSFAILATSSLGQTNSHTFTLRIQDYVCPAPSGLVGWWRGQDEALDAAGTNHGTLQNGAAYGAGQVGRGFSFDGSGARVEIPDSAALKPTNVTVEAWVKFNSQDTPGASSPGLQYIVFKKNTSGGGFEGYTLVKVRNDALDRLYFVVNSAAGPSAALAATNGVVLGRWYHVVGTYDGSAAKLYVDGVLHASQAASFPLNYDTRPVFIGASGEGWVGNLNGMVDEASIYSRALSGNEITALYNAGAAGKCGLVYIPSLSPLPGAGEGAPYSQPLAATGGTTPYNFALLSGTLPAGLSLSTNGVLSGTPTVPGVREFTVRITDAQTRPADRHFFLKVNARPVLPVIVSQSVNELATLTVTNAATDADPLDTLTYTLINSPTNAGISANGVITWTPTEEQGPATTNITTVVTDNGTPNLSRTNTFTVVVREVNVAPVLTLPPGTNINELVAFTAAATATDADVPANSLTFAKVSGPANLSVSASGVINWTPAEDQAPGTHTVTISVTDSSPVAVNATSLSVTSSFQIVVNEVNVAPVLGTLANYTVNPGQTISITATDADLPANSLSFSLLSPPTGATISSGNGVFNWRPGVALANSTNVVQVRVQDDGVPPLADTESFTVIVNALTPVVLTVTTNDNGAGFTAIVSGGANGLDYIVQASTNLTQWIDVDTGLSATPPFKFVDSETGSFPQRFFRVRLQP